MYIYIYIYTDMYIVMRFKPIIIIIESIYTDGYSTALIL